MPVKVPVTPSSSLWPIVKGKGSLEERKGMAKLDNYPPHGKPDLSRDIVANSNENRLLFLAVVGHELSRSWSTSIYPTTRTLE